MKAIVCELCGSNDIVKQGDFFVCQHCGTKYTTEEAKKLIGTVKIDKSEEAKKALILARRAREDNNSENAQKFYGIVMQEDPENWEASFFYVYYQAMQCTIANISSAAISVSNCLDSSFRLIKKLSDEQEIDDALSLVIRSTFSIADMLASAAISHYNDYPTVDGALDECSLRVVHCSEIYQDLEKVIIRYFPNRTDNLITTQQRLYSFMSQTDEFFNDNYLYQETARLVSEILKNDPTFGKKPIRKNSINTQTASSTSNAQTKKGGCYVATSIYGSYDCPQVWTLRRFRDYSLSKTWYGRAFIHTYYAISPTLVKWFGETEWFRNMWKLKLDRMVEQLNSKGFDDTPYRDRNW